MPPKNSRPLGSSTPIRPGKTSPLAFGAAAPSKADSNSSMTLNQSGVTKGVRKKRDKDLKFRMREGSLDLRNNKEYYDWVESQNSLDKESRFDISKIKNVKVCGIFDLNDSGYFSVFKNIFLGSKQSKASYTAFKSSFKGEESKASKTLLANFFDEVKIEIEKSNFDFDIFQPENAAKKMLDKFAGRKFSDELKGIVKLVFKEIFSRHKNSFGKGPKAFLRYILSEEFELCVFQLSKISFNDRNGVADHIRGFGDEYGWPKFYEFAKNKNEKSTKSVQESLEFTTGVCGWQVEEFQRKNPAVVKPALREFRSGFLNDIDQLEGFLQKVFEKRIVDLGKISKKVGELKDSEKDSKKKATPKKKSSKKTVSPFEDFLQRNKKSFGLSENLKGRLISLYQGGNMQNLKEILSDLTRKQKVIYQGALTKLNDKKALEDFLAQELDGENFVDDTRQLKKVRTGFPKKTLERISRSQLDFFESCDKALKKSVDLMACNEQLNEEELLVGQVNVRADTGEGKSHFIEKILIPFYKSQGSNVIKKVTNINLNSSLKEIGEVWSGNSFGKPQGFNGEIVAIDEDFFRGKFFIDQYLKRDNCTKIAKKMLEVFEHIDLNKLRDSQDKTNLTELKQYLTSFNFTKQEEAMAKTSYNDLSFCQMAFIEYASIEASRDLRRNGKFLINIGASESSQKVSCEILRLFRKENEAWKKEIGVKKEVRRLEREIDRLKSSQERDEEILRKFEGWKKAGALQNSSYWSKNSGQRDVLARYLESERGLLNLEGLDLDQAIDSLKSGHNRSLNTSGFVTIDTIKIAQATFKALTQRQESQSGDLSPQEKEKKLESLKSELEILQNNRIAIREKKNGRGRFQGELIKRQRGSYEKLEKAEFVKCDDGVLGENILSLIGDNFGSQLQKGQKGQIIVEGLDLERLPLVDLKKTLGDIARKTGAVAIIFPRLYLDDGAQKLRANIFYNGEIDDNKGQGFDNDRKVLGGENAKGEIDNFFHINELSQETSLCIYDKKNRVGGDFGAFSNGVHKQVLFFKNTPNAHAIKQALGRNREQEEDKKNVEIRVISHQEREDFLGNAKEIFDEGFFESDNDNSIFSSELEIDDKEVAKIENSATQKLNNAKITAYAFAKKLPLLATKKGREDEFNTQRRINRGCDSDDRRCDESIDEELDVSSIDFNDEDSQHGSDSPSDSKSYVDRLYRLKSLIVEIGEVGHDRDVVEKIQTIKGAIRTIEVSMGGNGDASKIESDLEGALEKGFALRDSVAERKAKSQQQKIEDFKERLRKKSRKTEPSSNVAKPKTDTLGRENSK